MIQVHPCVVGPFQVNMFVLVDEPGRQFAIIDAPGIPELVPQLLNAGYAPAWLALTHGHIDHIAGLKQLKERLQCPVYLHEADEYLLNHVKDSPFREILQAEDPPQPDHKLAPSTTLALADTTYQVIETPGHTPGGVCIYNGSDTVFSGDTLFYGSIGRTDLPGGDHPTLITSIRSQLLTLPDTVTVCPGHGPDTTIGHERSNNPFLQ